MLKYVSVSIRSLIQLLFIVNTVAFGTGKSMSEGNIFALTNPQYDKRLFMKIASSEHKENMLCKQIVFCFDIQNNLCTHVLSL